MLEIFKNNFYLLLYAVTLILALIRLPQYYDSILKYFPILIVYTLCNEFLGMIVLNYEDVSLIIKEGFFNHTHVLYNIYDVLFFMFFYRVYWNAISGTRAKAILKYGAILYIGIMLVNSMIENPLTTDMLYAYSFGTLLLIFAIFSYLYSLNGQSKNLLISNLLFWVSIGSLVFHIGYLPIIIIENTIPEIGNESYQVIRTIHLFLIVVMYVCYCIGFIKMRRMPSIKSSA